MRKGNLLVLLILLLDTITVLAQPDTSLTGQVTDQKGKPLAFATISVDSFSIGTNCNENGNYSLGKIPVGTYQITASSVGYVKQSKTLNFQNNKPLTVNFALTENSQTLGEVTISGEKTDVQKVEDLGFNVSVVDAQKFENRSANVSQLLNQTAGVRIRESGGMGSDFNFYLNGLSGEQVRFFIDGIPLENYGGVFTLNNIPANLVERVEVYKGAVPVSLGSDALGGAVNIILKKDTQAYLDASYSIGSYNTHRANLSGFARDKNSGLYIRPQLFYNYSDNNYTMYNHITETPEGEEIVGDFERFHDTYWSYLAGSEIGFTQTNWADELMLGVNYGKLHKDIQTNYQGERTREGEFILNPYGRAFDEEDNLNLTLKYRNTQLLSEKLSINLTASFNDINRFNIDTASNQYNWEGEVIGQHPSGGESNHLTKITNEWDQYAYAMNTGLGYRFNGKHQLDANFVHDFVSRKGRNTYYPETSSRPDPFIEPNTVGKSVMGLAYQNTMVDGRLQTIASAKWYNINIHTYEAKQYIYGTYVTEDVRTKQNRFGGGLASRFRWKKLTTKASYEYALRQPEDYEIFGDGFRLLANPQLEPESSHNLNLGGRYAFNIGSGHEITLSLDGFSRKVKNLIRIAPGGGSQSQYVNLFKIFILGGESEIRYNLESGLQNFTMGINATYQAVMNDEEYVHGTTQPNYVYRDKLYNTPWLFGNWDAGYAFNFKNGSTPLKLSVFYNGSYVHEFYLNYPSVATAGPKNTVPTQFINNVGATLSAQNGRYNLTLECNNLSDARAYDYYAVQKPGRMYSVKCRVFLSKIQ